MSKEHLMKVCLRHRLEKKMVMAVEVVMVVVSRLISSCREILIYQGEDKNYRLDKFRLEALLIINK